MMKIPVEQNYHPTQKTLWAIALRSPYPTLRSGQAGCCTMYASNPADLSF